MERITHFEIPTDDPEKAMSFYEKTFGWSYQQWGNHEYWMAMTGDENSPGINGAIMKRRDPAQPVVNSISVKNIHETIKKIEQNGGTIVVPVNAIPGIGWLAYFKDHDLNIFGVMQEDRDAR